MTKLVDLLMAGLRKANLPDESTQEILETQGSIWVDECVTMLRQRVEAISKMISRIVAVNRGRTAQEALDATGRKQYIDREVVDAMPRGEGGTGEVFFFKPRESAYDEDGLISDDNMAKEYDFVGLKPADPYLLAAANEADPALTDNCPNATHWKNADGKWCYVAFRQWGGERFVGVYRRDFRWGVSWSFAGVRK